MTTEHSVLSDMLTKNISEVVVFFRSDEDGMKRYEEFSADEFRGIFEQLEALRWHAQYVTDMHPEGETEVDHKSMRRLRNTLASYPAKRQEGS